ncbi:unnamed protein product [Bursaphelenchus xylophilus]|uniref:(pine wood nematode) hypothetical protein n=1 Tax=Bursaphelenchus xylophilus TaxID=6326 RepID=A0A1I7RTG7_BURXY|nr:unnamed protein product [Bursaphelenchus xylophilus]CAG9122456.1 unnamed protein product [Bursaphelenchus xylophilus]
MTQVLFTVVCTLFVVVQSSEYEELIPGLTDIGMKLQAKYNRGWSKADKAVLHRVIASVGPPSNEKVQNLLANETMFNIYIDIMDEALNMTDADDRVKKLVLSVERAAPQMFPIALAGDNATVEERKTFAIAFTPAILAFEEMTKEMREEIIKKVPSLTGVLADNETRHAIRLLADPDFEEHVSTQKPDETDVDQMSESAKQFMHQLIMTPEKFKEAKESAEE